MVNNDTFVAPDKISFDEIFSHAAIYSKYLTRILKQVLSIISRSIAIYKIGFGPIYERRTIFSEGAEVTEHGDINLDSQILKNYDDDVVMAIIAHELAHYHLKHYIFPPDGSFPPELLNRDYEADDLARKWGFNIDKFREVCGPPTIQEVPIRR
jgi:hypothetical protein